MGEKRISKIVITGGPCAGKTTAMERIQNRFAKMGYTVIFIPETATELILGGVAPWTCGSNLEYQMCQMQLQLYKEKVFMQGAESMDSDRILIVCDRGLLDNKAYMSEDDLSVITEKLGISEIAMQNEYDAVFHLVTAAKGNEDSYTLDNNSARTETVEEAVVLDDKIIAAWTGHPHLRIIGSDENFESKMEHLMKEITSFLGEPVSYEIERKYLIKYPDTAYLESLSHCDRVDIIQTYLQAEDDRELRVRQCGKNGAYVYTKTEKLPATGIKRIENEEDITQNEYLDLLMDADPNMRQIRKVRYRLTYKEQYFEIDIYPFWDDKAIMEIELCDESEQVELPEFIEVIREVTDDYQYKNSELAKIK